MVKRNNRRRRRPRPKRMRRRTSRQTTSLSNSSAGLRNVHAVRGFNFFPAQVNKTTGVIEKTWLDKLYKYGAVVMKLFGVLLTSESKDRLSAEVAVTSSVQSILIGAEDMLYSHPIANLDAQQRLHVGYTTAKLRFLRVSITLMGAIGERAGRLAANITPLTREQALDFHERVDAKYTVTESISFEQLLTYPGTIVAAGSKGLVLTYTPNSSFGRSYIEIGELIANAESAGGLPVVKLLVGYQDLASNESDPSTMYSLKEAVISVEVQATVDLAVPSSNERYIRLNPRTLMPPVTIKAVDGLRSSVEINTTDLRYIDGSFKIVDGKVQDYVNLESLMSVTSI